MAKSKTEIHVTTVFDGELDATDVFVSLIAQKYSQRNDKEYLAKKQDLGYNKDKVQHDRVPVSYTHLDVYKRQPLRSAHLALRRNPKWTPQNGTVLSHAVSCLPMFP